MRKEMQKTIEEIKLEKKIPKELKNETRKIVFNNFLMAIAIILYFIILILGSKNSVKTIRAIDFNIFSLILLGISIILFEKAYKKDSGTIALYGIEVLIVALVTLFFTYIVFELNKTQRIYFYMIGAYIAIYYIVKSIVIEIKAKKRYKKAKMENMKEVIEPVLAEKRESTKKNKKNENEEKYNNKAIDLLEFVDDEIINENIFKEIKVKKEITKIKSKKEVIKDEKIKEDDTIGQPQKRRGRPKKIQDKVKEVKPVEKTIEPEINIKPVKRRGRPKKNENNTETTNKEIIKQDKKPKEIISNTKKLVPQKKSGRPKKKAEKTGNKKEIKNEIPNKSKINQDSPKKRGRPRKVVS